MAGFLTTSAINSILNAYLTGGTLTNAALYMGLSTSDPGKAGSMTGEPSSTGSYGRVSVGATGTTIFSAASSGQITNANGAITFPTSSAAWSTGATALAYWFIATSQTIGSGTVLMYGQLDFSVTVNAANLAPSFATSQLTLNGSSW
jgi:hypothetical protein